MTLSTQNALNPMDTQIQRGERFRALHTGASTFLMPNAWDPGSACILADSGFQCLATTSAGVAYSLGQPDYEGYVSRSQMMECLHRIATGGPGCQTHQYR